MVVTNVRIDKYNPKERGTCAECTVTLDSVLDIHKVLVVMGEKGEFVAYPNTGSMKQYKKRKIYRDIVHPIKKELADEISKAVLDVYNSYS